MDLTQFAPAAVIGVAISVTELCKKYIRKEIIDRVIWLPSLIVGIVGAILLDWGKPWNIIAWNGISYASAAIAAVLVVKRAIK